MTAKNKLLLYSLFICILILFFVPNGRTAEITLATISTDVNSDTFSLVVDIDETNDNLKTFFIDSFETNTRTNRESITIEAFIKEGLKIRNNLARIETVNFLADQGGTISIDAVYNILIGKRKLYELEVAKDKTSWHLFSKGKIITKIFAHANIVPIIGVVGAKDLTMQ